MRSYVTAQMKWNGQATSKELDKAIDKGMTDAMLMMLEESNRTCPHDTGHLQRSGAWSYDPGTKTGAVAYGANYGVVYAVHIHEHPEYHFRQGRRGKWLELTWQEQAQTAVKWVRDTIEKTLGGKP